MNLSARVLRTPCTSTSSTLSCDTRPSPTISSGSVLEFGAPADTDTDGIAERVKNMGDRRGSMRGNRERLDSVEPRVDHAIVRGHAGTFGGVTAHYFLFYADSLFIALTLQGSRAPLSLPFWTPLHYHFWLGSLSVFSAMLLLTMYKMCIKDTLMCSKSKRPVLSLKYPVVCQYVSPTQKASL